MIGYIYQIECLKTGKSYIGQTINLKQRQNRHFNELRKNKHENLKLQNAWNKYGEQEFHFRYWEFEIANREELNTLECDYISKFNSLKDGYNLIPGGTHPPINQKVKNEDIVKFLCIQNKYGDGYGKTAEEVFNWSKGTASVAKRRVRFLPAIADFDKLSEKEKDEIAINTFKEYDFGNISRSRILKQGGCSKAYNLELKDYYFAFMAQEMGYGYTAVAVYLEVKPSTVKDWFNGRSRKKEKEQFIKLNIEEKNQLSSLVKTAELNGKPKSTSSS